MYFDKGDCKRNQLEENTVGKAEEADGFNSRPLDMTSKSSESEKSYAVKLVIEHVGNDELRQLLKSNISLLESAKDWVRLFLSYLQRDFLAGRRRSYASHIILCTFKSLRWRISL